MSKNIVRQTEFGRDHGLIHEMVVTGRKAGAGSDFYATLAHDLDLFRKVVNLVCGTPAEIAFHEAVKKGVTRKGHYYRFFDPGISLVTLGDLPIIREKCLIAADRNSYIQVVDERNLPYLHRFCEYRDANPIYGSEKWAKEDCAPQERFLRIPMKRSFGKTFAQQEAMLLDDEEIAPTRVVTMFLVIYELVYGKKLLIDTLVNCKEVSRQGQHWKVGMTGHPIGAREMIIQDWKDEASALYGAAAMKKL